MILLIDNYDSFSYNLVQLIGSILKDKKLKENANDGRYDVKVIRNDELSVEEIEALKPTHIILSPGPGRPADAGVCEQVALRLKDKAKILGVCLGHQGICEAYGAEITYAKTLMHGKQSVVTVDRENELFKGLNDKVLVARYHSLAAKADTMPPELKVIATADDGEVMAVAHTKYPMYGLQFHPESVLTPEGRVMLENFLA